MSDPVNFLKHKQMTPGHLENYHQLSNQLLQTGILPGIIEFSKWKDLPCFIYEETDIGLTCSGSHFMLVVGWLLCCPFHLTSGWPAGMHLSVLQENVNGVSTFSFLSGTLH